MESVVLQAKAEAPNLDNYFIQKQLEIMLDTYSKKMAVELSSIQNAIERLNTDVFDIKRRLNENRTASIITEPVKVCESNPLNNSNQVQQNNIGVDRARNTAQAPILPRCGNYKSEDVAIDKFFYFGGGKKR